MDKMPAVAPVSEKLYEYRMSEEAVRQSAVIPTINNSPQDPRTPNSRGLDAQRALHSQYVLQLLQLQRRAGFLCDITIHVRDKSFKAHKPLLAACSLYFRALFSDETTKDSTALNLNSLTPTGFEILLDYIYSGSLAITSENSSEVLSAATCLQMTNVVETCLNFMRSSFRMSKNSSNFATNGDGHSPAIPVLPPRRGSDVTGSQKHLSTDAGTKMPAYGFQRSKENTSLQNNLQILSTSSINEDEFRSMMGKQFPQSRTISLDSSSPINDRVSITPSSVRQSQTSLPSTSQLQSVLPYLIENNAVQPTPEDVQRILERLPSSASRESTVRRQSLPEQPPSLILAETFHNSIQPNKGVSLTNKNVVNGSKQHSVNPRISEFYSNSSNKSSAQNPIYVAPKSNALEDRAGLDLSTISTGATNTNHTPEHYSGRNQTVYQNPEQGKQLEPRHSLDDVEFASVHSSDDQDTQSVEISDAEEDHGRGAWSTDRSEYRKTTTDLSGTPCSTPAQTLDDVTVTSKNDDIFVPPPSDTGKGLFETISEENETFVTSLSDDKPLIVTLRRCTSLPPATKDEANSFTDNESHRSDSAIPSEISTTLPVALERPTSNEDTKPLDFSELGPESLKYELVSDDDDNSAAGAFPVQRGANSDLNEENDGHEAVLDLSLCARKRSLDLQKDSSEEIMNLKVSRTQSVPDTDKFRAFSYPVATTDPGMQLAADALSLLRQSQSGVYPGEIQVPVRGPSQQQNYNRSDPFPMSNNELAGDETVTYSRKPRRTTGGQTCTWPGCGRLFRHRNIYEEHQRLHELGIPVSQLRKCYMGARVKKTVREQLEELRTTDSGENDMMGQYKGRKRKSISGAQETIRKRVTIKDRMDPLQVYSNVVSRNPLEGSLPNTSMFTHPTQLPTRLGLQPHSNTNIVPCSVPMICPSSSPHFPAAKKLQLNSHAGSQLVQVMGADGVVRLLQPPSSPVQQRVPIDQSSSLASHIGAFQSMTNSDRSGRIPNVEQQSNSQLNPVEATLALLGIPTPVRRGDHAVANTPLSGLSLEQIRRRLALRETSDNASCSMLPLTGGPAPASAGQSLSSLGHPISNFGLESTIRPGNVTGTSPYNTLAGPAFSAARISGALHAASNADNVVVPIPNQYPLVSPSKASHSGAQV